MRTDHEVLTDSDKSYYSAWEQLFDSQGWAQLTQELEHEAKDLPERAFRDAKSFDEVLAARAATRKLEEILSYPNEINLRLENLIESRLQAIEDAGLE